jgi:hypothetical protein
VLILVIGASAGGDKMPDDQADPRVHNRPAVTGHRSHHDALPSGVLFRRAACAELICRAARG